VREKEREGIEVFWQSRTDLGTLEI